MTRIQIRRLTAAARLADKHGRAHPTQRGQPIYWQLTARQIADLIDEVTASKNLQIASLFADLQAMDREAREAIRELLTVNH